MSKKIWILLIGFVFLFRPLCLAEDDNWNIKKSGHFIIHYKQAPPGYINEVLRRAEKYYQNITDYLGFRRFNFWTWEKRCKIYIYSSKDEYLKQTDAVSWSRGRVHVLKKEITTYVKEEQLLDYILPHELGHIIFREVVGFQKELPLWLDEGVALLQEKDRDKYLAFARKLIAEEKYVPFDEFFKINSYSQIKPKIFYSESASMVEFLLEYFGRARFIKFCRKVRDCESWETAFKKVYNQDSLNELEQLWVEYSK